jgi:hypothetical protein
MELFGTPAIVSANGSGRAVGDRALRSAGGNCFRQETVNKAISSGDSPLLQQVGHFEVTY